VVKRYRGKAERHILAVLASAEVPITVYDLAETYRPGGGLSTVQVLKQAAWRLRERGEIDITTGRTRNGRAAMALRLVSELATK
jgi:hypothetical protein